MTDYLLWFDCETTGLDPEIDLMLEVGWFITSDDGFTVCSIPSSIIVKSNYITHDDIISRMNQYVLDMHTNNGLINDLASDINNIKLSTSGIEDIIISAIKRLKGDDNKIRLAGNSPHFDRSFIKKFMPKIDKILNYQHTDASCINRFVGSLGIEPYFNNMNHRALDDAKVSHNTFLYCKRAIKNLAGTEFNLTEMDFNYG